MRDEGSRSVDGANHKAAPSAGVLAKTGIDPRMSSIDPSIMTLLTLRDYALRLHVILDVIL